MMKMRTMKTGTGGDYGEDVCLRNCVLTVHGMFGDIPNSVLTTLPGSGRFD